MGLIKQTRYFQEQILRKRPYLKLEWCSQVLEKPLKTEQQDDGRWRYWGEIEELGKVLRVVTLEDGKTIHNAFPDRSFKEQEA